MSRRAMNGIISGNNGLGSSGNKRKERLPELKKNGSANNSSNREGPTNNINSLHNSSSKDKGNTNKRRKMTLNGTLMSTTHGQFLESHAAHQRKKFRKHFEGKCLSIILTYNHRLLKKRKRELMKGRSWYQTHTEKLRQALRNDIINVNNKIS
mmetsp:Transcript_6822/g.10918  ORF Transcript_6822/g.10918 Transcript_6822/m.10918 type:complete len:153 (+) Transcript_6822:385-843(+)